jgi:hypothetical protein
MVEERLGLPRPEQQQVKRARVCREDGEVDPVAAQAGPQGQRMAARDVERRFRPSSLDAQKREALSWTSAFDQAFLNRSSIAAASPSRPWAFTALDSPNSDQPLSGWRRSSSQ